ncbi:hypothetical protein WA158_001701 [Blastocystis sp. Blastoise]
MSLTYSIFIHLHLFINMEKIQFHSFKGASQFRNRIVMSTLLKKPIVISNIRDKDEQPGLKPYEISFLKLVDAVSTGSKIDINETGTRVMYNPGFIRGGKHTFDCDKERGIGYYAMGIIPLLIFGKQSSYITFTGVTNNDIDISVDILRIVTLPSLKYWGITEGASLAIKKRGCYPNGGGEVYMEMPTVRELEHCELLDVGVVKKIRGITYSMRVSPQFGNRIVDSCREVFNHFIPDVHIFTDHYTGAKAGNSPGYGCTLIGETTTDYEYTTELMAGIGMLPEDLGKQVAHLLLEEIHRGGCIDSLHQGLHLILFAFSPRDVSKIRFGEITDNSIKLLRLIKEFVGVSFRLEEDNETHSVIVRGIGSGYKNIARKVT